MLNTCEYKEVQPTSCLGLPRFVDCACSWYLVVVALSIQTWPESKVWPHKKIGTCYLATCCDDILALLSIRCYMLQYMLQWIPGLRRPHAWYRQSLVLCEGATLAPVRTLFWHLYMYICGTPLRNSPWESINLYNHSCGIFGAKSKVMAFPPFNLLSVKHV